MLRKRANHRETRRRHSAMWRQEAIAGYLFISPWIVGFVVMFGYAMIVSFWLSLTNYDVINPGKFVGFANYVELLTSDMWFWHSLKVTARLVLFSVPLVLVGGFCLALLMNRDLKGIRVIRTLYYLPAVVPGVAAAVLWGLLFEKQGGAVNTVLESVFGTQGPDWFMDASLTIPMLTVLSLWGVGGSMIIYLGSLQAIPTELYEAAEVDGASRWHKFSRITVPMVSPVIFYSLVTGVIGTFQIFSSAYLIFGSSGGFKNSALFYVFYLYQKAFETLEMGVASAMAWILFAIVMAFTALIFKSSSVWVYYEAGDDRK